MHTMTGGLAGSGLRWTRARSEGALKLQLPCRART